MAEEDIDAQEEHSPEQLVAQADSQRKDQSLQLDVAKFETDKEQTQQRINIEKAKVKLGQAQFDDDLEFQDVNKEADRQQNFLTDVVKNRTERVSNLIQQSNLV